jgi:phosphatidylglycerol:prolipoprotein diacylglycerol transferase
MLTIEIDPILFRWGPVVLGWHGVWFAIGFAAGYWVLIRQRCIAHVDRDRLSWLLLWVIVAAFSSARLSYVLLHWGDYAAHSVRILALYEGGTTLSGALIGGTVATILCTRHMHLALWDIGDATAVALPAGELVGRIGCLIAGDIWGLPTSGTWGVAYIHPNAAIPSYLRGVPMVPIPALIQLWDVGLLLLLPVARRHLAHTGLLFPCYAVAYATGRFVTSAWQLEAASVLGLKGTQLLSIALAASGLALGAYRWRRCAARAPME